MRSRTRKPTCARCCRSFPRRSKRPAPRSPAARPSPGSWVPPPTRLSPPFTPSNAARSPLRPGSRDGCSDPRPVPPVYSGGTPILRHLGQARQPLGSTVDSTYHTVRGSKPPLQRLGLQPGRPAGGIPSYWTAWLNHNANNAALFRTPTGRSRGLVLQSCQTANRAEGLADRAALHLDPPAAHQRARVQRHLPTGPPDLNGNTSTISAPHPDRDRLCDLLLRPAPVPVDLLRRSRAAEARGLQGEGSLHRGLAARPGSRRADLGCSDRAHLERRARSSRRRAEATLELNSEFAPIPSDTRAMLASKDAFGRDLCRADAGLRGGRPVAERGSIPAAQVADPCSSTRSSARSTRVLRRRSRCGCKARPPRSRVAATTSRRPRFARPVRGRGRPPPAPARHPGAGGDKVRERRWRGLRCAFRAPGSAPGTDPQHEHVFGTTAARNEELAETFVILPTFLRESRATLTRLEEFAVDSDPVVTAFRPGARELAPTAQSLQRPRAAPCKHSSTAYRGSSGLPPPA